MINEEGLAGNCHGTAALIWACILSDRVVHSSVTGTAVAGVYSNEAAIARRCPRTAAARRYVHAAGTTTRAKALTLWEDRVSTRGSILSYGERFACDGQRAGALTGTGILGDRVVDRAVTRTTAAGRYGDEAAITNSSPRTATIRGDIHAAGTTSGSEAVGLRVNGVITSRHCDLPAPDYAGSGRNTYGPMTIVLLIGCKESVSAGRV